MASRYIPKTVDRMIRANHYFECAWCGERLTERHHITEFSSGGEHTTENLILLCPNCHTQVHKHEIKTEELIQRKSTHKKCDRLSGGVQFEMTEPFIKLGNSQFKNVSSLIMYKNDPIISLVKKNNEFFLSTRFYNSIGELIFWMSSNRYWTMSNYTIQSNRGELLIRNNDDKNNILRIWEKDSFLHVEGRNYIGGMLIDFNPLYLRIGNITMNSCNVSNSIVGIKIC